MHETVTDAGARYRSRIGLHLTHVSDARESFEITDSHI